MIGGPCVGAADAGSHCNPPNYAFIFTDMGGGTQIDESPRRVIEIWEQYEHVPHA